MTRKLALYTAVALASALAACSQRDAAQQAGAEQAKVQSSRELTATLDRIATAILKEWPHVATSLAVPEATAGGKYSDRWPDLSAEGVARQSKLARDLRAELQRIDRA